MLTCVTYSTTSVGWICDQCSYGHSWSAPVRSKTSSSGCPQREGCKVCEYNSWHQRLPWDDQINDDTPPIMWWLQKFSMFPGTVMRETNDGYPQLKLKFRTKKVAATSAQESITPRDKFCAAILCIQLLHCHTFELFWCKQILGLIGDYVHVIWCSRLFCIWGMTMISCWWLLGTQCSEDVL